MRPFVWLGVLAVAGGPTGTAQACLRSAEAVRSHVEGALRGPSTYSEIAVPHGAEGPCGTVVQLHETRSRHARVGTLDYVGAGISYFTDRSQDAFFCVDGRVFYSEGGPYAQCR